VVSVPGLGRERFTNDRGEFLLTDVPAGSARLVVRHIGYTPATVKVAVRAGRTDSAHVALAHIAVELNRVTVQGLGTCTAPGPPSAAADPVFAAIFEQLRENADRYRLLAEQYPFAYAMERMSSVHYVSGESVITSLDTTNIGTGARWNYVPGTLVVQTDGVRNRQVLFNIPTLLQFAERAFLDNHCFANAGVELLGGRPVIRIDFSAAARIKPPDVSGSMYLDRETFQIRRSTLRLTRIPDETPQIAAVEVVTDFSEIVPSISVPSRITSVHVLHTDRMRPVLPDTAYEVQRMVRMAFLRGKPGEDVKARP
ncbi:MAG: carboxypeptidase-like regulatory domain-containing protein, partial [Gemmatimonadaceae bacterium]